MPTSKINLTYFWAVVILGVVIVLLSWFAIPVKGPESWVTEWTVWLATYVGIGVSARGLWIISDAVAAHFKV